MHAGEDAAHELAKHNEIVASLEAYERADGVCKVALQVIAFSMPPEKLKELRHVFQTIDKDDSGTISLEEFKEAMALHPEVPMERVEHIFSEMDVGHKGEVHRRSPHIRPPPAPPAARTSRATTHHPAHRLAQVDYTSFLAATVSCSDNFLKNEGNSILGAFHVLDTDHDGYITAADLTSAFDGCISPTTSDHIIRSFHDNPTRISFEEFKRAILELLTNDNEEHFEEARTLVTALMERTNAIASDSSRSKSRKS